MDPWRELTKAESATFRYDGNPFAGLRGYILWTQPAVYFQHHQGCGCMLSKRTAYYRPHHDVWGEFPVRFEVSDLWDRQFLQNHPGLVAVHSSSYGALYGQQ